MTDKLYIQDSYVKEFEARVEDIKGNKVSLDRTHFFIQGSGQSGDSGKIGGIKVIDTQKGGWHILVKEPDFSIGDTVQCKINWDRRYPTMRIHSGVHFVEHFQDKLVGKAPMLKTNVNHKKDLTDYKMEMPNEEIQKKIEDAANEMIAKNIDINIWVDDSGYRHWDCDEIKMGCTGTHVKNTSEIGKIKVSYTQKAPGVVRVETTLA